MEVTFFGTRGSLAVPGPHTVRYGGNTTCSRIRAGDTLVVLDMGTGAYVLGQELAARGVPVKGHVLISHTHWDHIQGLPFFAPFFRPGNEWDVYAPRGLGSSLRDTLSGQMQYAYFPLELEQLGATIRYHELVEGTLQLGDISVRAQYLNHPALTLGYRLEADGVAVVHALDHEPFASSLADGSGSIEGADRRHMEFLAGADLVIHDAQYLASEYPSKIGWGHSTVEYTLHIARAAGVSRLALAHHDPNRSDDALDAVLARYRPDAGPVELFAASEGMTIELRRDDRRRDAFVRAHDRGKPSEGAVAMATIQPALASQSVLVTGANAALRDRLAKIIRMDNVPAATCEPDNVLRQLGRLRPALLIIADSPTPDAMAQAVRTVRDLDEPIGSLPVILASHVQYRQSNEELGITDRLVEPFSDNYARTRLRAWLMRRACRWAQPPVPDNEAGRIAALHRLNILDTPPDRLLDSLVDLAAGMFDVPIAAVSLVDRERQWFKASCGLAASETPRDESFCAHVVANPVVTMVPDTLHDERFADHPAVTGLPGVRFYAGHPIILADGHCIGTLCIADVRPRHLDGNALGRLGKLAELVLSTIKPNKEDFA